MTRPSELSFAERYGPWAVIAGASEGNGRAFVRNIAAKGVNCILIARREEPLAATAAFLVGISARADVRCNRLVTSPSPSRCFL